MTKTIRTEYPRSMGQTAVRTASRPGWIILAAATVVSLLGGSIPESYQYVLLLATLVALGLPHGAVDHLVVYRLRQHGSLRQNVAAVSIVYLVFGGAYALLWFVAPTGAFVGFIFLTWYHWGAGDLVTLHSLDDTHLQTRLQRILTLVVRGGLPMLLPLVAFPEVYREVMLQTVTRFDPAAAGVLTWAFNPTVRFGLALSCTVLILGSLSLGVVRARKQSKEALRAWQVDAGETILLTGYFVVVPPVLAIGLYFSVWHALRHVFRVATLDDESAVALDEGRPVSVLWQFVRDATPLSVAALGLLFGLLVMVPSAPVDLPGFAGLYLVFLAVLTLPHVAVTTWADVRQGLYR